MVNYVRYDVNHVRYDVNHVSQKKLDLSANEKKVRDVMNKLFFLWKKKRFQRDFNFVEEIRKNIFEYISKYWDTYWIYTNTWTWENFSSLLQSCVYNSNYKRQWWVFTIKFKNVWLNENIDNFIRFCQKHLYVEFFLSKSWLIVVNLFWSEYHKSLIQQS